MHPPVDVGDLDRHDAVHVWVGCADPPLDTPLTRGERARADRYRFRRDRTRFVARRSLLRRLVAAYVDEDPAKVRFGVTDRGRPTLQWPASDLQFSVTSSSDLVAVALTRRRAVGIDVEWLRDGVRQDLEGRVCTPAECAALAVLPSNARTRAFFELWCHKEAVVKADGRGLGLPVDVVDVADALAHGAVQVRIPTEDDATYSSVTLRLATEYAAAAAVRGAPCDVRIMKSHY